MKNGRPLRPLPDWLVIDDVDREWASQHNWFIDSEGYASSRGNRRFHRWIFSPPRGFVVDHFDRDKLNNRRSNLRVVPHHVNQHNGPAQKNSKTGVRNVWFCVREPRRRNHYTAQIRVQGKCIHVGNFKTIEEASAHVRAFKMAYGVYPL